MDKALQGKMKVNQELGFVTAIPRLPRRSPQAIPELAKGLTKNTSQIAVITPPTLWERCVLCSLRWLQASRSAHGPPGFVGDQTPFQQVILVQSDRYFGTLDHYLAESARRDMLRAQMGGG